MTGITWCCAKRYQELFVLCALVLSWCWLRGVAGADRREMCQNDLGSIFHALCGSECTKS
jgi:hypothetical protein